MDEILRAINAYREFDEIPTPQRLEYTEHSLIQARIQAHKEILNLPDTIINSLESGKLAVEYRKIDEN